MMLTKVDGPDGFGNKTYIFANQYAIEAPAKYNVKEFIGRGAYGIVCSAINTDDNSFVAIKKISRLFEDAVDCKRVLRELKLLAFFDHPNVLGLKDVFNPTNPDTYNDICIVTQLMETDMQELLRSPNTRLKAGHCQYFFLQLLCALQYIHSAHVIHRDLKPGNLLTDADCNLVLCDFGLARGHTSKAEEMTHYVVTRWYRAPELLLVCRDYSYPVDIWAAACLAVEMITGKTLFPGKDYINQINLIVQLLGTPDLANDLPPSTSTEAVAYLSSLQPTKGKGLTEQVPELRRRFDEDSFFDSFDEPTEGAPPDPDEYFAMFESFVFSMLRYNPETRLTAKQAIAHPWLADVRGPITAIPGCEADKVFSWDRDSDTLSIDELRALFLEEIRDFRASH